MGSVILPTTLASVNSQTPHLIVASFAMSFEHGECNFAYDFGFGKFCAEPSGRLGIGEPEVHVLGAGQTVPRAEVGRDGTRTTQSRLSRGRQVVVVVRRGRRFQTLVLCGRQKKNKRRQSCNTVLTGCVQIQQPMTKSLGTIFTGQNNRTIFHRTSTIEPIGIRTRPQFNLPTLYSPSSLNSTISTGSTIFRFICFIRRREMIQGQRGPRQWLMTGACNRRRIKSPFLDRSSASASAYQPRKLVHSIASLSTL